MTVPTRGIVPGMRSWHRWIGIGIGVFVFGWMSSGIIMLIPFHPGISSASSPTALDLSAVKVTPAQAIEIAQQPETATMRPVTPVPGVSAVTLRSILGTPVYLVTPLRGEPVLVSAASGDRFHVTAERAVAIARESLGAEVAAHTDRLVSAPTGYWGRLPVFRVAFDDPSRTVALVVEATGEMQRNQRIDRLVNSIGHNVHVLLLFGHLPGGDVTRRGTMVTLAMVGLCLVLSGYWLALPRRWRRGTPRMKRNAR